MPLADSFMVMLSFAILGASLDLGLFPIIFILSGYNDYVELSVVSGVANILSYFVLVF